MTLVEAGTARSSLAARLDMRFPQASIFRTRYPTIRRELRLRYCPADDWLDARRGSRAQKCEPGCPGSRSRIPVGTGPGQAGVLRRHQHGIDHMDHAVRLI